MASPHPLENSLPLRRNIGKACQSRVSLRGNVLEIHDKGHFFLSSHGNKIPIYLFLSVPGPAWASGIGLSNAPPPSHQTLPLPCGRSHAKDSPGLSSAYTSAKSLRFIASVWANDLSFYPLHNIVNLFLDLGKGNIFPALSHWLEPLLIKDKGLGSSQVCPVS